MIYLRNLVGARLMIDQRVAIVTIVSTLLLIVDGYHRLTPVKGFDRLILYLAIPLAIVLVVFRERPSEYGFGFGDWKTGLILVATGALLMTPILWVSGRGAAMRDYYQPQVAGLPWNTFIDLFGWEFFFRGFVLFTYIRRFGPDGIWLQAVPFALAHIGKPELETLSTIFGGFAFGWIAYRTRSFLYPFLLHWWVASFTILAAASAVG